MFYKIRTSTNIFQPVKDESSLCVCTYLHAQDIFQPSVQMTDLEVMTPASNEHVQESRPLVYKYYCFQKRERARALEKWLIPEMKQKNQMRLKIVKTEIFIRQDVDMMNSTGANLKELPVAKVGVI